MTENKKSVTMDGKEYDYDTLSDAAKAQIANIQITDTEIAQLQARLGITQTARTVYLNALKAELEKDLTSE